MEPLTKLELAARDYRQAIAKTEQAAQLWDRARLLAQGYSDGLNTAIAERDEAQRRLLAIATEPIPNQ